MKLKFALVALLAVSSAIRLHGDDAPKAPAKEEKKADGPKAEEKKEKEKAEDKAP